MREAGLHGSVLDAQERDHGGEGFISQGEISESDKC